MSRFANERVLTQLLLLISGVALFLVTLGSSGNEAGAALSPVFFPRIILGLWIGLAALALMQDLIRQTDSPPIGLLLSAIGFIAVTLIYVNAVTRLGFGLSSVPFAAVSLWIFGIRSPAVILAYSVCVPGVIVVLFNHVLKMPLPTAPFTYLF